MLLGKKGRSMLWSSADGAGGVEVVVKEMYEVMWWSGVEVWRVSDSDENYASFWRECVD